MYGSYECRSFFMLEEAFPVALTTLPLVRCIIHLIRGQHYDNTEFCLYHVLLFATSRKVRVRYIPGLDRRWLQV